MKKPVYEFRNIESAEFNDCLCCGICGIPATTNRLIEQIMVADYILAIQNDDSHENFEAYLDSDGELKAQETVGNCSIVLGLVYASKIKEKLHFCGEWKTNIVTRICENCLNELKEKINFSYEEYAKTLTKENVIKMKKSKQMPLEPQNCPDKEGKFYSSGNNQIVQPPPFSNQNDIITNSSQNLQYLSLNPIQQPENAYFAPDQLANVPAYEIPVQYVEYSIPDYQQQIPYYQPQYNPYPPYQEVYQPLSTYFVNPYEAFEQPMNEFLFNPPLSTETFNSMQNEPPLTNLQPLPSVATFSKEYHTQQNYYDSGNNTNQQQ